MMKNILLSLGLLLTISVFSQKESSDISLNSMVYLINNSLSTSSSKLSDQNLHIEKATISLKTVYDKEGGGEFKFFLGASKSWELNKASTITFVFDNIATLKQKSIGLINEKEFEISLTKAMISATKQWKEISTISGLSKRGFSIDISFSVHRTTGGGLSFEIWGVGVDIEGEYQNSAIHTISLYFSEN